MSLKPNKSILPVIVSLLLAAFLFYYISDNFEDFRRLFSNVLNHWPQISLAALLFTVLLGFNGYQFYSLLEPFALRLAVKEWFGLSVVTNFYNLVTPFRGGMAIRALYLKRRHGFTFTYFLSVQAAVQVFILITAAFTGLISVWMLEDKFGKYREPFLLLFSGITILLALLPSFSPRLKETGGKWRLRLVNINNGWHRLKQEKKTVVRVTLLTLLQRFIKAYFLILTYGCLNIQLDFFEALFISSVGMFSMVIMILPGNLGIDDAVNVISANLLGIPLEAAIAAALLGRLINLTVCLPLGLLFSYILIKKNSDEASQPENEPIPADKKNTPLQ